MTDYRPLVVRKALSIREALVKLDTSGLGVLLLVDEGGRLLRTVTDGDIRRLLLQSHTLEDRLEHLPPLQSKVIGQDTDESDALAFMNRLLINHLPVVDRNGVLCGLFLRRDLDARIMLSTPHLGDHEMGFVEEAFRSNWIAPLGPNVDAFERELAAHVQASHAAAVSSGTAAIHLALRLLDVGQGDVVFCSSLTFVASANPILYVGARPVFIDADPSSWNMSVPALKRALAEAADEGKPPKAVIVVNLYGQSADMEPLVAACDAHGVPVIEDAAESLGATYKGRHSGTFGRIGIYSFNGNKIITTSGGGMLISEDGQLVERARFLSTQARNPAGWYEHTEVGYNYRMSNILAGIGRGQLKVLEDRVTARRVIFERYARGLQDIRAIRWMPDAGFGRCTRWLSAFLLDPAHTTVRPEEFIATLARAGIEARRVWKPMHLQPLYAGCRYYPHPGPHDSASFSDHAFASGICLPSGSNMTEEQQERIIRVIASLFSRKG